MGARVAGVYDVGAGKLCLQCFSKEALNLRGVGVEALG